MDAKYRRGMGRVAIATLVPWALSWAVVYFVSEHQAQAFEAEASSSSLCLEASVCGQYDEVVSKMALARGISLAEQRRNQEIYVAKQEDLKAAAQRWMARALWWGFGGVILAPIGFFAFLWVRRGFDSGPTSN